MSSVQYCVIPLCIAEGDASGKYGPPWLCRIHARMPEAQREELKKRNVGLVAQLVRVDLGRIEYGPA